MSFKNILKGAAKGALKGLATEMVNNSDQEKDKEWFDDPDHIVYVDSGGEVHSAPGEDTVRVNMTKNQMK